MTDEELDRFVDRWLAVEPEYFKNYLGEACYMSDCKITLKNNIKEGYTSRLMCIESSEIYGAYVFRDSKSRAYRYCIPKSALEKDLKEAGEILCNGEPIGYAEDLDLIPIHREYDPVLDILQYKAEGLAGIWLDECNNIRNLQKAKEKNMNAVTVVFMNGCTNRFEGKAYTYLIEGTYKEGDYLIFKNYNDKCVVVKVVAFITDLDTLDKSISYKELTVLGIADMTPYENEVKRQEKEARKAQIMEELEANFEEANKMNLYRELAKQDKGMAELLKELDSLDK